MQRIVPLEVCKRAGPMLLNKASNRPAGLVRGKQPSFNVESLIPAQKLVEVRRGLRESLEYLCLSLLG
jgi:hypothetical protein